MNDDKWSNTVVIACVLWACVALLMIAAWIALALGDWQVALLTSQFACVVSATAVVAHIRIYAVRISGIIRRLHGLDVLEPSPRESRTPERH